MSPTSIPETARPNARRITTARLALTSASWARGDDLAVCDEAVIDLLADLRHFCVARHIDFAACNLIAETHFEAEINGGAMTNIIAEHRAAVRGPDARHVPHRSRRARLRAAATRGRVMTEPIVPLENSCQILHGCLSSAANFIGSKQCH
jgi:hypothetical protein